MGAVLSLKFEESLVTLQFEMEMEMANPPTTEVAGLPSGTVFICAGVDCMSLSASCNRYVLHPFFRKASSFCICYCADDDLPARMQYKSLLTDNLLGPNVDMETSMVIGGTYLEATNIVQTVLQVQYKVDPCIPSLHSQHL